MQRRKFCKTTLAVAVAAAIPGCGREAEHEAADVGSLIPAVSSTGVEISIETTAVGELADSLSGHLYLPSDDGYVAAKRVWNGNVRSQAARDGGAVREHRRCCQRRQFRARSQLARFGEGWGSSLPRTMHIRWGHDDRPVTDVHSQY